MAMQFSARKTVIPNPANRGGYSAYQQTDPNEGLQGTGFGPDKLGIGLMSRADEHRRQYDANREANANEANAGNSRWNQGPKMINSAPRNRKMDGFFQAMQEQGVTKLAADAVTPGGSPSFFGNQFGQHGASAPAGYTHQRAMTELKNYSAGGALPGFATTPGGGLAHTTPSNDQYIKNILDGLKNGRPQHNLYGVR